MRGSCASRRFYHAFYRWHVVNLPPRGCRALSTTSPRKDDAVRQQNASNRASRHSGLAMRRLDLSAQQHAPSDKKERRIRHSKALVESPVLTSDEKPFDTLTPWEEVVRYRSEAGALLQIAVPHDGMARLREARGQQLGQVRDLSGARVEVGHSELNGDLELTSVTLSGTFEEVHRARDALSSYKPPAWIQDSPKSQSELPSHSLPPWAKTVREADGYYRRVEIMIPSDVCSKILERPDMEPLKVKGVRIESTPLLEAGESQEKSSTPTRSVVVTGQRLDVSDVFTIIYRGKGFLEQARRQKEAKVKPDAGSGPAIDTNDGVGRQSSPLRSHYLILEIPLGPNGEDVARRTVRGTRGDRLAFLDHRSNAKHQFMDCDIGKLRIAAPSEKAVRKAAAYIQDIVAEACRGDDLPSMDVQELEVGTIEEAAETQLQGRVHDAAFRAIGTAGNEAQQTEPQAGGNVESEPSRNAATTGTTPPYFYTTLYMPLGPKGEDVARRTMYGPGGSNLAYIHRHFNTKTQLRTRNSPTIKLYGLDKEQIRKAWDYAQGIVNLACQQANIPPLVLREQESGIMGTRTNESRKQPQDGRVAATTSRSPPAAQKADEEHSDAVSKVSMEDLKLGLRPLTHSVVLVTSQVGNRLDSTQFEDFLPFCRGVTVSSFNSVTMEPTPIISFNIRTPSRSWDAISSSGWLAAHLLAASPVGAALANAFALPYDRPDEPFWRARRMGAYVAVRSRAKGHHEFVPTINLPGGVVCFMKAKVDFSRSVKVGDHMIVIAEVKRIVFPGNDENGSNGRDKAQDANGLTYAKRGYRGVGEQIELATLPDTPAETSMNIPAETRTQEPRAQVVGQSIPTDHDARNPVGAATAETQAPASDPSDSRTAERIDIDYFKEIAEDEDDAPSLATTEPQEDPQREEVAREEEEHDFGFAAVEDTASSDLDHKDQGLVEDSDAAREEAETHGLADSEIVDDQSEKEPERKEESESQKRPLLDANST